MPPDASEPLYLQRIPERKATRTMLGIRYAWGVLVLLIVFFFVNSMFLSQVGLYLAARFAWHGHAFGARELGWVFAYAGFINIIVQFFLITRANRVASDRAVVIIAFAGMVLGFCGLAVVRDIGLLAVFLTMIIIGFMFTRATLTFELSRSAVTSRQGMIMGFNQSLMSVANIAAPLISGALIGHRLYVGWALSMAGISGGGAILAAALLATRCAESL